MRYCTYCEAGLIKGPNEMKGRFINREYCNAECKEAMALARREAKEITKENLKRALNLYNFGRPT